MNKERVAKAIDRVAMILSLLGLLGLAGLAGLVNPEYFRWSSLSHLSFLGFSRFLKAFFVPVAIPDKRFLILFIIIVTSGLLKSFSDIPALGFVGFLGFYSLMIEQKGPDAENAESG